MSGASSSNASTASGNSSMTSKLGAVKDLRCYACTSCPTFTNTSHLLTHLASKVHLRTLFELELCASQRGDEESAEALAKFHKWYIDERLGEHLVERFIVKRGKWSRERSKAEADNMEIVGNEGVRDDDEFAMKLMSAVSVPHTPAHSLSQAGHMRIPPQHANAVQGKRKFEGGTQTAARAQPPPPRPGNMNQSTTGRGVHQIRYDDSSASRSGSASYNHPASRPVSRLRGGTASLNAVLNPYEGEALIHMSRSNSGGSSNSISRIIESVSSPASRHTVDVDENFGGYQCPEEERDIADGPDTGVVFSFKGPRLRGKIWPGMGVFDTAITPNARRGSANGAVVGVTRPGEPLPFAAVTASLVKNERFNDSPEAYISPSPSSTMSPTPSTRTTNSTLQHDFIVPASNAAEHSPTHLMDFGGENDIDLGDSDIDAEGELDEDMDLAYAIRSQLPQASIDNNYTGADFNNQMECPLHSPLDSSATDQQKVCSVSLNPTSFEPLSSEDKHQSYLLCASENCNNANGCSQAENRELNTGSTPLRNIQQQTRTIQEQNRFLRYFLNTNGPDRQGSARKQNSGEVCPEVPNLPHENRSVFEPSFGDDVGNVIHVSRQMGLTTLNQAFMMPHGRENIRFG